MNLGNAGASDARQSWLVHEPIFQRFERAWQDCGDAALTDFLPEAGAAERVPVLAELIKIDLEYRWRAGRATLVEDYLARFPELLDERALRWELIQEEIRVRRDCRQGPARADVIARFPDCKR